MSDHIIHRAQNHAHRVTLSGIPQKRCTNHESCIHPEQEDDGWLPETEVYFRWRKKSYNGRCRKCERVDRKIYDKAHPEKRKEQKKRARLRYPLNIPVRYRKSRPIQIKVFSVLRTCSNGVLCINPDKDEHGYLPNTDEYFYKRGGVCRICNQKYAKDYAIEHHEEISQKNKKRYEENPTVYSVRSATWRKDNPEKIKAADQKYYAEHKDEIIEKLERWQAENPEKYAAFRKRYDRIKNAKRRSRKKSLPFSFTDADWQFALDYFGYRCAVCGCPMHPLFENITLAADHWIALTDTRADNPGTVPWNILPLCHGENGCNNSKHNRDAHEWLVDRFGEQVARKVERKVNAYFRKVKR